MTDDWTNGVSTLYRADAREIPLPDASVHMVVTSPPYWGLRDYGLGQWEGGDAECGHKPRQMVARSSTLGGGKSSTSHQQEGWTSGRCGHCGAVQQTAGIGLEATLGEWVENIVEVMREVRRVLRDDGTLWLNLGDSYAGSGKGRMADGTHSPSYGDKQGTNEGAVNGVLPKVFEDLPAKNLMGQPWRVAFALQDDGWILRSAIVWHKPNPMPESTTDRPTSSYEMVFLLGKIGLPQFWTHRDLQGQRRAPTPDYRWRDALTGIEFTDEPDAYTEDMIPCPDCGGEGSITREAGQVSMFGGVPAMVKECAKCKGEGEIKRWKRSNLWQGHDYFYDAEAVRTTYAKEWTFENNGKANREGTAKYKAEGFNSAGGFAKGSGEGNGANARNVWSIPTQGRPDAHFATFPDELPRRCILAGTSKHGVCGECGAPWARVVEKNEANHEAESGTKYGDQSTAGRLAKLRQASRANGGEYAQQSKTTGWQPTCACDADVVPAIVLDPFVGSGTTVAVAQALGRRGVGLDLNPEYLNIAAKRIGAVSLPLTGLLL